MGANLSKCNTLLQHEKQSVSPFLLDDFTCFAVPGVLSWVSSLIMLQVFLVGDESGMKTDQFSSRCSFTLKSCCWNKRTMHFWLCLPQISKKLSVCPKLVYNIQSPLQMCNHPITDWASVISSFLLCEWFKEGRRVSWSEFWLMCPETYLEFHDPFSRINQNSDHTSRVSILIYVHFK